MPGLLGAAGTNANGEAARVFEKTAAAMRKGARLRAQSSVQADRPWAMGRVGLESAHLGGEGAAESDVHVLVHGRLSNMNELERDVPGSQARGAVSPERLIRKLYQKEGLKFISRLRGVFCAVLVDEASRTLFLINDLVGTYPLYWRHRAGLFAFAGELHALHKGLDVSPALNPRGIADFITFGFLLGDKTIADDAHLLPPGAVLSYSWNGDRVEIERYSSVGALFGSWEGTKEEFVEQLGDAFGHAVRRAVGTDVEVGLALSGGLDTRAILSAIGTRPLPVDTYTVGVEGCADQVIAEELAGIVGSRHHFVEINTSYLGEFVSNLSRMVEVTDGMYLTHGFTEMQVIRFLLQSTFPALVRGHGGELWKSNLAWPFHTDDAIRGMTSKKEFIPYFLNRVNYLSRNVSAEDLFTPAWRDQIEGQARVSLECSLADIDAVPADLCSYLYLVEHHRRFTVPSLEIFRDVVDVRMPFVDQDVLDVLWRAPAGWREGRTLHRAIIGRNSPPLLRVRDSNTGAPAGAGWLVETIADKLNSLWKRLNVYGYRHYHTFDEWMGGQLLRAAQDVLLSEECLSRGVYREDTLRRLLAETGRGVKDHAYLLQILLILELWKRGSA